MRSLRESSFIVGSAKRLATRRIPTSWFRIPLRRRVRRRFSAARSPEFEPRNACRRTNRAGSHRATHSPGADSIRRPAAARIRDQRDDALECGACCLVGTRLRSERLAGDRRSGDCEKINVSARVSVPRRDSACRVSTSETEQPRLYTIPERYPHSQLVPRRDSNLVPGPKKSPNPPRVFQAASGW